MSTDPKKCEKCTVTNCNSCSASSSVCKGCEAGFFLQGNTCPKCSDKCLACTGLGQCTSCEKGYTLLTVEKTCKKDPFYKQIWFFILLGVLLVVVIVVVVFMKGKGGSSDKDVELNESMARK